MQQHLASYYTNYCDDEIIYRVLSIAAYATRLGEGVLLLYSESSAKSAEHLGVESQVRIFYEISEYYNRGLLILAL